MDVLLFSTPWLCVGLFMVFYFRNPPGLPKGSPWKPNEAPFVSIIVPARNEEANVEACVSSLTGLDYPSFEILVVDDQSEDRTAEIVRGLSRGEAQNLRLIEGESPPEGWFGKPWACWQGAGEAKGEILLFTDADTVHDPKLLDEAVRGLKEEGADVCTLIGRQVMDSFWERLLQPQFFMLLAFRFPRIEVSRKPTQWKHAIANGQYLLFRREVYEVLGGHEAVAGEVAEDLSLAQLLVRGGWKLMVRGTGRLKTRMYRSLEELVEGWSKNVATAALQSTAPWLLPIILPLSMLAGVILWLVPPGTLAWALATGTQGSPLYWSGITTGLGVLIWGRASLLMKGNPLYGLLFPLGSSLAGYIVLRSWRRGARIKWKGRSYEMSNQLRTRPPHGPGS